MNNADLRALVRDSIARHLSRPDGSASDEGSCQSAAHPPGPRSVLPVHASHALFGLTRGDDGACLIEPAVRCNRCGYCLSYGH